LWDIEIEHTTEKGEKHNQARCVKKKENETKRVNPPEEKHPQKQSAPSIFDQSKKPTAQKKKKKKEKRKTEKQKNLRNNG